MSPPQTLSLDQLARARTFLHEQGRPLEAALFRYHFESAPLAEAVATLAAFQNPDGGFGQALEPDLRAPDSSAVATSIGLRILHDTGAMEDDALAVPARAYLLRTQDPATLGWRIVPETTDAHPHAPWWQQAGREHDYDEFGLNPTAELLGYLYRWAGHVPQRTLDETAAAVMQAVASARSLEMHDLLCCARLFSTAGVPEAMRQAMAPLLRTFVGKGVARDRKAWSHYGLRPLQVVKEPASPFLTGLENAVEANLDYELETQEEDGAWYPTWSWGRDYPDVWVTARREWAGVLTLRNLRVLRAFGRIQGLA